MVSRLTTVSSPSLIVLAMPSSSLGFQWGRVHDLGTRYLLVSDSDTDS